MPSYEYIKQILSLDSATGVLRWSAPRPNVRVGCVAGCIDSQGYRKIKIDGKKYGAHRLVWLLVTSDWPEGDIDHANLNKDDNRFENLRAADDSSNGANRRVKRTSVSGLKGVSKRKTGFVAYGGKNGKLMYLGYFKKSKDAHAAYCRWASETHGEFARRA